MTAPNPSSVPEGTPSHELLAPRKMTPIRTWVSSGFRCALVRAPLWGAINGYVRVPSIDQDQLEELRASGDYRAAERAAEAEPGVVDLIAKVMSP